MSNSGTRQLAGQPLAVGRPISGPSTSKSGCPPTRPGTVWRPLLMERLAQADLPPIVSVVAPSGFGKTTLLSQWAERDDRPTRWVALRDADNDPPALLGHLLFALEGSGHVDDAHFEAIAT